MKLKVAYWTYNDDTSLEEGEYGWAARNAIIDDIRANGYLFSGYDHQESLYCTPVLNDGKIRRYSQRGWGDLMAEAHGYTGRMDYSLFTFGIKESALKTPQHQNSDFVIEDNLSELYKIEVGEEQFLSAAENNELRLAELPEFRYLDIDDNIILTCGERSSAYQVAEIQRVLNMPDTERRKLVLDFYNFANPEKQQRAEEALNAAGMVLAVKLKECAHTCTAYLSLEMKELDDPDWSDNEAFKKWDEEKTRIIDVWSMDRDELLGELNEIFSAEAHTAGDIIAVNRTTVYGTDISEAVEKAIGCFKGKTDKFNELLDKYCAEARLKVFICIRSFAASPAPCLRLSDETIKFLHDAGIELTTECDTL